MLLSAISSATLFSTKIEDSKGCNTLYKKLFYLVVLQLFYLYVPLHLLATISQGNSRTVFFSFLVFRFTLMLRWVTKHCKFTCASKEYNSDEKVDIK